MFEHSFARCVKRFNVEGNRDAEPSIHDRDSNSVRMPERISNPRKPGIVSGCAPIL
jgi:hypothetical protein